MRRERLALRLAIFALGLGFSAYAGATDVCGTIATSQIWTKSGNPYLVTCNVAVAGAAAPVVTIKEGVIVKFCQWCGISVGNGAPGGIDVQGISSEHVTFTSNQQTPGAGWWNGITLGASATATSSMTYADVLYGADPITVTMAGSPTLSNVKVQYASGKGIVVNAGSPTISGASLLNNQWGLYVTGGSPTVNGTSTISSNSAGGVWIQTPATLSMQNVTISSNTGYAMSQDAGMTFGTMTGVTVQSNTNNAVEIRGSTVAANTTWKSFGVPYATTNGVWVAGASTPVLTIEAGANVKFCQWCGISVGENGPGGINVQGTASQHVTFTSSQTTPTPGYWGSIRLWTQSTATSSLNYADVLYGTDPIVMNVTGSPTLSNVKVQYASGKGILVVGGTPTISAANLLNNQWGIYVTGGSPTLNSSTTISANSQGGIRLDYPGTISLQTVTISGNTGFAISQDARTTLGTVSGVTVQTNTSNAVEIRWGEVSVNTTWKWFGTPYVLTGTVSVAALGTPVLTIPAGATVKFSQWCILSVGSGNPGRLTAVGTNASPITFTASTTTPGPGFWSGIQFHPGTTSNSSIRYATVSYGWGIHVIGSSPTVDHVTLTNNNGPGISYSGVGTPTIKSNNFTSNSSGITNSVPTTPVDARLNWWNAASGPSGSGPGTGQSVSAGVKFEPWLTGPASHPQFITAFNLGNTTFNPNIGINANFSFTTQQSGNWTLNIKNGSTIVRTFSGTGTTGAPSWDGRDTGNNLLGNGTYTYELLSVAGTNSATPATGRVTIDTTKLLAINNVAVTPLFFSPNSDGVQDTTTISGVCMFDGASWALSVKNSSGTQVHSAAGAANPNISYTWNGSGQGSAVYTLELTVTDGPASATQSPTVTLDKTNPVATITAPTGPLLSNINQSGSANVNVNGSSTDANFLSWALDYGPGAAPSSWTSVATGTSVVSSGTFASWSTLLIANGQYTLRLTSNDKAGNKATATRTLSIGNFNVTGGSQNVNAAQGGVVTFTSIVPNLSPTTVSETLVIKDPSQATVKTLWTGTRAPGTYQDQWDGRNTAGNFVPAGAYRAVATVTAGAATMTWDPPPAPASDASALCVEQFDWNHTNFQFWPFNNKPLKLDVTIAVVPPRPVRVWVLFSPTPMDFWFHGMAKLSMCSKPGNFCTLGGKYLSPGTHTLEWLGFDNSRTLRTDITGAVIMGVCEPADGNVIQMAGTTPTISNLQLTPSFFRPGNGTMQISFGVGTFQTSTFSGTVVFERLDQIGGTVSTIAIPSQAPGTVSLQWNGTAASGLMLAAGRYLATVTITDSLGSVSQDQALITVAY